MTASTSVSDLKSANLWVSAFAELVGTALLVLFSCGSALNIGATGVTGVSLTFGFSVASIVWSIGRVSGGHINPGVSWGLMVARRISVVRGLIYIVVQTVGAVIGATILLAFLPNWEKKILADCTPEPAKGITSGQVFGIEFFIMFVLVLVVCSSVDAGRRDLAGSIPLTVGVAITMGHLFAIPYTGSGMNPARAFGPAAISGTWTAHWAYWLGPMLGSTLAACFYEFLLATNAAPGKLRRYFSGSYDPDDRDHDLGAVRPTTDGQHGGSKAEY